MVPGPCSLNQCSCYPELSTSGILPLMGRQQILGVLWTILKHALSHFPIKHFSLKTQLWLLPTQTPLPGLQGFFLNIFYSVHSFLLGPPTRTKLTGPGNFVNAFPVPCSVILQMQVLFLVPIVNLSHLFQEALSDRAWPTLILPLLCISSELNTFPAFMLGRAICSIHSLDKHLLRVSNHVSGICCASTVQ